MLIIFFNPFGASNPDQQSLSISHALCEFFGIVKVLTKSSLYFGLLTFRM